MNYYNPQGRYATGDIAIFKGRPWRSLVYHDESEVFIPPDENFRFWDMLPIDHDLGKDCQYCPGCNGRTVTDTLVCNFCGADYNDHPEPAASVDAKAKSSNLFARFFGKPKTA